MRFYLLALVILLLSLSSALGVCTVSLSDNEPVVGQDVTTTSECSENSEKNVAYTLTWYDQTGTPFQIDTGTTPNSINTPFFELATIPAGVTSGTVNLTGTNLEGSDSFTVTTSNTTLLITNAIITEPTLIGKGVGFIFEVNDTDGNAINGALCQVCKKDSNDEPIGLCSDSTLSTEGRSEGFFIPSTIAFKEDRQYLVEANCLYDSTGNGVYDFSGVSSFPFNVSKWLEVNTIIDGTEFYGTQEIEICANVSNLVYDRRLDLNIYHQIRCSAYDDNNNDTDRNLIVSDDNEPDRRGIGTNTTQNQCKRFVLPEPKYLQGKTSSCYASTTVETLDEQGNILVSYSTTSTMFNFTIEDFNLDADWTYLDNGKLYSNINLSSDDDDYNEYTSNNTNGNIDIRLYKDQASIRHEDQYIEDEVDLEKILLGKRVANIEASYCNGTEINNVGLEYLNDGNLEIELRGVDLTENGCYNVSFDLIGDGKMYLSITIIFIAAIALLYFFSDRLEFEQIVTRKDGVEEKRVIHTFKYIVWFVCLWLLLGLINIALKINDYGSLGLNNTIGTLYTASTYIAYIFSAVFIFYLIYKVLMYLGGMFSND